MDDTKNNLNKYFLSKEQQPRNPWAIAWAIVTGNTKFGGSKLEAVRRLYSRQIAAAGDDVEKRKALAAKIAAGIQSNMGKSKDKSKLLEEENMIEQEGLEKRLDPAAAALAGWWLGGEIAEWGDRRPTAAQQREFERQVQQSMRNRGRKIRKESAIEKMQQFFKNVKDNADTYVRKTPVVNGVKADPLLELLQKRQNFPPRQGMRWDQGIHHWVRTDRQPGRLVEHRRFRTSYGKGSREQVGGHGKGGQVVGVGGGRVKGKEDVAVLRRLGGFTHSPKTKIASQARKRKTSMTSTASRIRTGKRKHSFSGYRR